MLELGEDLPNINDVMTKQEQAQALMAEELAFVTIGKGQKAHSAKQIREAADSLIRFFPDLKEAIEKECNYGNH